MDGVKVDWGRVTVADMAAFQKDPQNVGLQAVLMSKLMVELPDGVPPDVATYEAMTLAEFNELQSYAQSQKPPLGDAPDHQFDWDQVTVGAFGQFQQGPKKIQHQIPLLRALWQGGPDEEAYYAMPLLEYEALLQAAMDARATDTKKSSGQ